MATDEIRDDAAMDAAQPEGNDSAGPESGLSRRNFMGKVARMTAAGLLVHFTLFGEGEAKAAGGDSCPGGLDPEDVCNADDPDRCPGQEAPADNCPTTGPNMGNRTEDECDVGTPAADICDDSKISDSDQCWSGTPTDDACGIPENDKCWTGATPEDSCPPNGDTSIDACPGGGAALDNCTDPAGTGGDACDPGGLVGNKDDCGDGPGETPDICSATNDDVCYSGHNSGSGSGGDDSCCPPFDSDTCTADTAGDDLCQIAPPFVDPDNCPTGASDKDLCGNFGEGGYSEDECSASVADSDVCSVMLVETDECPGGTPAQDTCSLLETDECPGGMPTEDTCSWYSSDVCPPGVEGADE
jgi:hypothetical protein